MLFDRATSGTQTRPQADTTYQYRRRAPPRLHSPDLSRSLVTARDLRLKTGPVGQVVLRPGSRALRGGDTGRGTGGVPDVDVDKAKGHEPAHTLQQFERVCPTFCSIQVRAASRPGRVGADVPEFTQYGGGRFAR